MIDLDVLHRYQQGEIRDGEVGAETLDLAAVTMAVQTAGHGGVCALVALDWDHAADLARLVRVVAQDLSVELVSRPSRSLEFACESGGYITMRTRLSSFNALFFTHDDVFPASFNESV